MTDPRIAIVGAGIGGLTLAVALHRRGMKPVIFERAESLGEVGAGITLWPNATKALFSLGLQDAIDGVAEEPQNQSMWHFATGEIFRVYPRGPATRAAYGAPLYLLHRRDLHDVLVNAVHRHDPSAVRLNSNVTGVVAAGDRAILHVKNQEKIEADLVVGCDGIRSTVREQLFGSEPARFTGIVAWRALVPIDLVPRRLRETPSGMHIGPDRNVSHYSIRKDSLFNYLGFAKVDTWTEEGWMIRADPREVLEVFKDFQPDIISLLQATPPEGCFKWGLFDRDPIPRWTHGRVTLLGDAAHPMLPFLGQGAGMVIEDAVVLARAIAESPDVDSALLRYESARRERTALALLRSRAHAEYWNTHPDIIKDREPVMEVDLNVYDAASVPI